MTIPFCRLDTFTGAIPPFLDTVQKKLGQDYLNFMGWFFCLIGFKMTVDGLLREAGDMKMFTLANLFIRVMIAVWMAPRFGLEMVWYAVPVGWFVNQAGFRRIRKPGGSPPDTETGRNSATQKLRPILKTATQKHLPASYLYMGPYAAHAR